MDHLADLRAHGVDRQRGGTQQRSNEDAVHRTEGNGAQAVQPRPPRKTEGLAHGPAVHQRPDAIVTLLPREQVHLDQAGDQQAAGLGQACQRRGLGQQRDGAGQRVCDEPPADLAYRRGGEGFAPLQAAGEQLVELLAQIHGERGQGQRGDRDAAEGRMRPHRRHQAPARQRDGGDEGERAGDQRKADAGAPHGAARLVQAFGDQLGSRYRGAQVGDVAEACQRHDHGELAEAHRAELAQEHRRGRQCDQRPQPVFHQPPERGITRDVLPDERTHERNSPVWLREASGQR
ncbi:hypothetical protein BOFL111202_23135 [Bordetella flabilis]